MNHPCPAASTFDAQPSNNRKLAALLVTTVFSIGIWFLCAWMLSNARLLHLEFFVLLAASCAAFFLVLVGIPALLIVFWIRHFLEEDSGKALLWFVVAQTALALCLGVVHWQTRPQPVNQVMFAEEIPLQQLSEQVNQKAPGIYFVSAWQESGSFYPAETFFAGWLDFPLAYDVPPLYLYHSYEKERGYPPALTDFLEQRTISSLPAAIVVDTQGNVFVFEALDYAPVLTSENSCVKAFRQYLAANYPTKKSPNA